MTVVAMDIERPAILGGVRDGEQLRLGQEAVEAPRAPRPQPASLPAGVDAAAAAPPPAAEHRAGGEPTLDDLLVGAWEGLTAHRTVACPVCHGAMTPRYGAGPAAVGGRCRDCDSTLG